MADSMAALMAHHAARIGWLVVGGATVGYLVTADDRYIASGVAVAVAALAINVGGRILAARQVVDDDIDSTLADLFAADAEALDDRSDPLDEHDDLELPEAIDALEPLFEELDDNPMARAVGEQARRGERASMSMRQRRAWVAITSALEGQDPAYAPRCTCPASGGVLTRSCRYHERHAW